jgi:hypothetical protein
LRPNGIELGVVFSVDATAPALCAVVSTPRAGARPGFLLMTVFVYVNTSKQVGDPDHIKVFATDDAAETWFAENDPEGVAFEYEVLG